MSAPPNQDHSLIGQSASFTAVLDHVSQVAILNKPILIIGERGTGKELIASRLHFLSRRWDQALVKVNCAALPESLLESELFGHEAGAFTGASKMHTGRFERADEGTLFLDEIASMSIRLQEKLLRIIEYGEFERVGGSRTQQIDVRLIGAANVDLPDMAARGGFREDLLDRLSFDVITLPPLRERRDDIPLLAEHFALLMVKDLKRDYFPGFSEQAMDELMAYAWPGNLRELKNVVERAVYRGDPTRMVTRVEFDPFASPYRPRSSGSQARLTSGGDEQSAQPARPDRAATNSPTLAFPGLPYDFKAHVREREIELLNEALRANRYNQRKTAEALAMSYHQLRGYLRKYAIDLNESTNPDDDTAET